ncbi:MAG: nuclear transport factor 2 family protein [Acidimicrobiia bacterium]
MNNDDLIAREAIRHTLASYHIAGDGNDADGYAAVFTEDGVVRAGGMEIAGREQLREWKAARTKVLTAAFVRHNLTTCKIDLTGPDSATGRAYFFVVTDVGPDHCGTYDDEYRKVGDEWLIASRNVDMLWLSPDSRFRPPPAS